jgi:hypothetical protein
MTERMPAAKASFLADRACTSKMRYRTKSMATQAAKRTKGFLGRNLKAYHCPWCQRWHLTTKG